MDNQNTNRNRNILAIVTILFLSALLGIVCLFAVIEKKNDELYIMKQQPVVQNVEAPVEINQQEPEQDSIETSNILFPAELISSTNYTWETFIFGKEFVKNSEFSYPKELGEICQLAQEIMLGDTMEMAFCDDVPWKESSSVRFEPNNKQLVYRFETTKDETLIVHVDTNTQSIYPISHRNFTSGAWRYKQFPKLSPLGTYLTFGLTDQSGFQCNRYVVNTKLQSEVFPVERMSCDTSVIWSPDEETMAYCTNGSILTASKSNNFQDPQIIYTTQGSIACDQFDEEGYVEFQDSIKYDELVAIDGVDIWYPIWRIDPETQETEFVRKQYLGF